MVIGPRATVSKYQPRLTGYGTSFARGTSLKDKWPRCRRAAPSGENARHGVDLPIDLGLSRRSTWFADECLLQHCQPVERGGRQRAFLHRGERILELLRRCHTDQDDAYRWMRERKPRGGFGQARGKPLLDQRHQSAGAQDIGVVA